MWIWRTLPGEERGALGLGAWRPMKFLARVSDRWTPMFRVSQPREGSNGEAGIATPETERKEWMDALTLLKDDHEKVKKLLTELDSTTERAVKTREELFTKVKKELEVHESIEEEIFYPALKEHPKAKELVLEAYEEHNVVDMVMAEISSVPFEDETWGAKLTVMKENVEHHIDEEESEMFKQARQVFDKDELSELGARMEARKQELLGTG
jgi:hemerythrin-like domain-containing protein